MKCAFLTNSGNRRFIPTQEKLVRGDPVDVLSGQVVEQRVDFTLGQTVPLSFIRTWARSKDEYHNDGLCGRYWVDNFSEYAEVSDNGKLVKIATAEGTYLRFALPIGYLHSVNPDYPQFTLHRYRDFLELYNRETQTSKIFEIPTALFVEHNDDLGYPLLVDGHFPISRWEDRFGNLVEFVYNEAQRLTRIQHTDGLILLFSYQNDWLHQITRVDNGQQQVLVTYAQDENGHLIESDALLDYHLFYHYDAQSNLTRWADNDKTWVDYHYDEQGRVIHSIGADGFYPVWFEYAENQTRVRDGKGNVIWSNQT